MTLGLRLLRGSVGDLPGPVTNLDGLINAAATAGSPNPYTIGPFSSTDGGATYTAGVAATITAGSGWESIYVKDPSVIALPGGGYRCYYCGWDGSNFQLGRADASTISGTWTKYGSNPIIGVPNDGSYRASGANFPVGRYDASLAAPYQLWITGSNVGVFTIGFLDSSDGVTWTDHGRVINISGSGWMSSHVFLGAVQKVGSTYYVLFGGRDSSNITRSGYATCTDPADVGTYSAATQYANLNSNLTIGGYTWQSNQPRMIARRGSTYVVGLSVWNPTPSDPHEGAVIVTTTDLTTLPVPGSSLMIPFSSWHANSAENPSGLFTG